MADLADGESVEMQGSGKKPYVLKNTGGVYSCTCPAWRNQSLGIERRTCKHLRKLRGDEAEAARVGDAATAPRATRVADDEPDDKPAPPLLLAHVWENDIDLAGWWMSEKLDGVRAYWNGSQLLSRLGNVLHAPDWFTEGLPTTPLDGELWLERKAFQQTVSIVRRQDKSDHWRQVRYVVFDAPALTDAFEERQRYLVECLAEVAAKHITPHVQERCRDLAHLREELQRVESLGGEGLMLRQPGSRYEAGRSTTLLKVKTFHDAEAEVIEHLAGKGRHQGRLGALLVRLPDGTEFSVGTGFSDKERGTPPAVGSTVTFRYQELSTGGVPRFPSFVRLAASPASASGKPATAGKAKAPVKAPSIATSPPARPQYFEFIEGKSAKFWEITLSGVGVAVRYGRIGTQGQTQTKSFGDVAAAQAHVAKLIAEKTEKGYESRTRPQ